MPRSVGSFDSATHRRGSGRLEITGHRAARDALTRGQPLRGLALQAQRRAMERWESEGSYQMVIEAATKLQAVADVHWHALLSASEAEEPNLKTVMDLGARCASFYLKAAKMWMDVSDMQRAVYDPLLSDALELTSGQD